MNTLELYCTAYQKNLNDGLVHLSSKWQWTFSETDIRKSGGGGEI